MITAHLTVNIESRSQQNTIEDIATCLENLAADLRERATILPSSAADTLMCGISEINYLLVQFPQTPNS